MDLLTYISDMGRRRALAEYLGRNPVYLWQIATGRRRASTDLAQEIESATRILGPEEVSRSTLRPDVWGNVSRSPAARSNGARA